MIKVLVNGARGKMGTAVVKAVGAEPDLELVGEIDLGDSLSATIESTSAQVVVDFTHPSCAVENTQTILLAGACPVVGTTGFQPADIAKLQALASEAKRGGVIAPNFAIGAVLLMKFASEASRYLPDVEIIELHHDRKADAPSGTAIKTAEWIAQERGTPQARLQGHSAAGEIETVPGVRGGRFADIPIHSVRLPGLVAHEEVILGGLGQILTIRHDSISRDSFMPGVVLAVKRVPELDALVYGLEHLLDL